MNSAAGYALGLLLECRKHANFGVALTVSLSTHINADCAEAVAAQAFAGDIGLCGN
jgi:hypothetical protein